VLRLAPSVLAALLLVLVSGSADAAPGASSADASARAYAIKIVSPTGETGTPEIVAPPDGVQFAGSFAHPSDGSIVATGPATASVATSTTTSSADASASSELGRSASSAVRSRSRR
jgi:hypothetical protein